MSQLELIPITEADIPKRGVACADCHHSFTTGVQPTGDWWCQHPNLADIIEPNPYDGEANTLMQCSPVRDLKVGCGHVARWFEPRVKP